MWGADAGIRRGGRFQATEPDEGALAILAAHLDAGLE
jgi:hypothetical protein